MNKNFIMRKKSVAGHCLLADDDTWGHTPQHLQNMTIRSMLKNKINWQVTYNIANKNCRNKLQGRPFMNNVRI